jgi:hypothetical protein
MNPRGSISTLFKKKTLEGERAGWRCEDVVGIQGEGTRDGGVDQVGEGT